MVRTGILCVPRRDDEAISVLSQLLRIQQIPIVILQEEGVGSQKNWIEEVLRRWCDEEELDLILTVGGTMPAPGASRNECVPEATATVLDRSLPGLSEEMRRCATQDTPLALLDRGIAGIRGRTLIINLPAQAAAALLFLECIIEVIEPLLAHLQDEDGAPQIADDLELHTENNPSIEAESQSPKHKTLSQDEFAAFLQNRRQNQG